MVLWILIFTIYYIRASGQPLKLFYLNIKIGNRNDDVRVIIFLLFIEDWTKEVNYISALQIYINE